MEGEYSPLCTKIDFAAYAHSFSGPITLNLDHVEIIMLKINAPTRSLLEVDCCIALVGDVHASHDGVILWEYRVRQIGGNGAVVVVHVNDQR